VPALDPVLRSPFVRGAVSGLGVVNVFAGLFDLTALFSLRHRGAPHV